MKELLLNTLRNNIQTTQHLWDEGKTEQAHEFLLFLKPELTRPQVDLENMLSLFFSIAKQQGISLKECIVHPTTAVKKQKLMERNYSKLNRIAHEGQNACSPEALDHLRGIAEGPIFGGYQFLKEYPYFSEIALSIAINNVPTYKLGYGTYASILTLFDQHATILNGFHPHQIHSLTKENAYVVAFRCGSDAPWKSIRADFVGTIVPETANTCSLRYQFWKNRKQNRTLPFCTAYNGVHVSAGPLEAMHQYQLFFDRPICNTRFWKHAITEIPETALSALNADSKLKDEHLYHLTEDMDMLPTIELLKCP